MVIIQETEKNFKETERCWIYDLPFYEGEKNLR